MNLFPTTQLSLLTLFALAFSLMACGQASQPTNNNDQHADTKQVYETGEASWYGPGLHGNPTASGEPFNQRAYTAAHPELAFGTKVKVTNLENELFVIVRINDRGPFAENRIIDLSKAAAKQIGMLKQGTAQVQLEIIESEKQ